jgi:glycosyltransferase involved in cell wall biosynthesis
VKDFDFCATPKDYFLFVGRIIDSKGIGLAVDMTKRIGAKLYVAGQGDLAAACGGTVPDHVTEIGYVEPHQRKELMKNAKALIAPTLYNEPFGGVTIEALFSGTPTITSDWGGFAENNLHGITGYRCRNMEQYIWACKNIDRISRQDCRDWAVNNFSLERVGRMYEEYFNTLLKVHDGSGGFYAENPDRTDLEWLTRYYPTGSIKQPPTASEEQFLKPDAVVLNPKQS